MLAALAIVALIAAQRLGEVFISNRNTSALMARGAVELGANHYPAMILLHVAWFVAIVAFLPRPVTINWYLIGLMLVFQLLRLWVMVTLGPFWTTRVITLPGAPLVTDGPFRFLRHPNYMVVVGEIAVLPLAFGEVGVVVVFSVLNAAMLTWRIHVENKALAPRRPASQQPNPA
jgi:methyltransferase